MSLIRNINQTKQALDFTGIQNGKIHPTDIDAVLEFDDEVLILIEVKRFNNDIPTGQRLVLERICDSWKTKKSIVLLVNVNVPNDIDSIPMVNGFVTKYYINSKWNELKSDNTIKSVLNKLGQKWNISMFHYRNHGSAFGRVLLGMQVSKDQRGLVAPFLDSLGYTYVEESENIAYKSFLD